MDMIERIMEVAGRPTPEEIQIMKSPFAESILESIPQVKLM